MGLTENFLFLFKVNLYDKMNTLKVENFGPIGEADVSFGDITFLVGAQALGKSLFLELLKLLEDKGAIINTLRKYNYIISNKYSVNCIWNMARRNLTIGLR